MVTVSLTQAKAKLNELLVKVEAGQDVVITRHGKAVACMTAVVVPRKPIPAQELTEFRATMPPLR